MLLNSPFVSSLFRSLFFFFQAEDGIRDKLVTGVQTCALPIWTALPAIRRDHRHLGNPLGVQRAYPQPGAFRAAAPAEEAEHRAAQKVLRWVQPRLWTRHGGLRSLVRSAHSKERNRAGDAGGLRRCGWFL